MNLESTNTVSLLTAISANTETIAEMQNDLTVLVGKVTDLQHTAEKDRDLVWGQIKEVHSLLESLNESNEYYCNRCHDLLLIVASLVLVLGITAIMGKWV